MIDLPKNIRKFVEDKDTSVKKEIKTEPLNKPHAYSINSAAFKNTISEIIDDFHSHLDICYQCRNHPMQLCPTGAILLQRAGNPNVNK